MNIRKALVIDTIDWVFLGLRQSLHEVFAFDMDYASSKDVALSMIRKHNKTNAGYDLLIIDIRFQNGFSDLGLDFYSVIKQIRNHTPGIRIIGHSSDRRPFVLLSFVHEAALDACVLKGQNGTEEMIKAIRNLGQFKPYISPEIFQILNQAPPYHPDNYDKRLLTELANGSSQKEISNHFSKNGLSPSSLSSIEKRINLLKERLRAQNNVHLISRAHELGIIGLI